MESKRHVVNGCARCGQTHVNIVFKRFKNGPILRTYTHWALCPETGEPIIMYELGSTVEVPGSASIALEAHS